jgi:hypothetical protein
MTRNSMLAPRLIILSVLSLALLSTVTAHAADDFVPVRGSGVGETEELAVKGAYYFIFNKALVHVAGNEAEGAVGKKFRKGFERDFDGFRKKYFSPDTDHTCTISGSGKHTCQVRGTFKLAALNFDLRKAVKSTERKLSNKLVFFLAATKPDDEQGEFLRDKLEGEFARDGHRIVAGRKARKSIKEKKVDFGLAIQKIEFTPFEYNKYDQRMSGAVTVRFRLTDLKGGESLAVVPTAVSTEIPGTSKAVLRTEIVNVLSEMAAAEIARRVTESVLTFQHEGKDAAAAEDREDAGEELYLVRLVGLTKRDRKDIRAVRKLLRNLFHDSRPKTAPGESDGTQITLAFSTAEEVLHDDIVDEFYAINEDRDDFGAEYIGGNEFTLYYKPEGASASKSPPKQVPAKAGPKPAITAPIKEEREDP